MRLINIYCKILFITHLLLHLLVNIISSMRNNNNISVENIHIMEHFSNDMTRFESPLINMSFFFFFTKWVAKKLATQNFITEEEMRTERLTISGQLEHQKQSN